MAKKTGKKKVEQEPGPVKTAAPAFSVPVFNDGELELEWEERMRKIEAVNAEARRLREEKVRRAEAERLVRQQALSTTMAEPGDRMMRYRRTPPCPACGAHPVVCTQRRGAYAAFRCRQCGHRWEVF
jgi:DNA-directed RNA polymerase subunit M/transcription elongation factor TFIIS